ncbi:site-specific integrase [Tumebacillus lipolyticus]|uniref:Tyrosine recombinase XerC n=1 Tax=Tumebacillus lipolyticus TaxID=1280370 RepID=A0ABW5A4U9_9BACL
MSKQPKGSSKASRKTKYPGVYSARNEAGGYEIVFDGPRTSGKRNQITEVLDPEKFNTAAKAASERARRIAEVQNGRFIEPCKMTVIEFLTEYIESRSPYIKVSTKYNYSCALKFFSNSAIANIQIAKLNAHHIEQAMIEVIRNGLGVSSARLYLRLLSRSLRKAVRQKLIAENPCDLVELPRSTKKEVVIMSPEEMLSYLKSLSFEGIWNSFVKDLGYHEKDVKDLWSKYRLHGIGSMPDDISAIEKKIKKKADASEVYLNLATLFFGTGARRGELLGICDDDIDFQSGTLTFRQSVVRGFKGRPFIQESLKSDSSRRTITIHENEMRVLKRQIMLRNKQKIKLGARYNDNGLVFATPDGRPMRPSVVSLRFRKTFVAFERPDFSLHDTRHTHASLLIMAGLPITDVAARLGHANPAITLSTYTHFLQDRSKVASDKWGEILRNASV